MKILVISLAGIGDTLLITPLIHELRANFPDAHIDAFVRWPASRDLLQGNPHLNTVYQHKLVGSSKLEVLRFLRTLRREHYDITINTHPQSRIYYRVIARVVGAPLRLSHDYECSGWLDRLLVNRTIPQDYEKQSIEMNLDLLPLIGARPLLATHEQEIFLSDAEEQWAEAFFDTHQLSQRKVLGVHVGSGSTKNLILKRWPLNHYLALFQELKRWRCDLTLLLFGGPDEEADLQKVLAETGPSFAVRAVTPNFRLAAALIRRCDAFLSVDTSLMHLATAVKVPNQIVIQAPTLNRTNEPYGNPFVLVKNPVVGDRSLEYYRYDGRPIQGTREELLKCMASISVESVLETVKKTLGN
jgi:heptosyltransferase-2